MQIARILCAHKNISRTDKEIILAYVIQKPREFVIAHPETQISFFSCMKFFFAMLKRKQGYPVAVIVGHKEFYGLDFLINKHTLVPRPETELMVDLATKQIEQNTDNKKSTTLIDIGTGSGCIPISIMKTTQRTVTTHKPTIENPANSILGSLDSNHLTPSIQDDIIKMFAIDISKKALRMAKKNAKKHKTNINFLHGNLLKPIHDKNIFFSDAIIITANLPYLTQKQFLEEPSIQKEPHSALVAKDNGLALYKELLVQVKNFVKKNNISTIIYMEIDPSQEQDLTNFCQTYADKQSTQTYKDLSGQTRVISVNVAL